MAVGMTHALHLTSCKSAIMMHVSPDVSWTYHEHFADGTDVVDVNVNEHFERPTFNTTHNQTHQLTLTIQPVQSIALTTATHLYA